MICKNCGELVKENEKFCLKCGCAILKGNSNVIDDNKKEMDNSNQNLKGLGGWLVIVLIGLFATVLYQIYYAYLSIELFANGVAGFLSNPSSESYIPGYSTALKFELIVEILFVVGAIYLICLFFQKSKRFPKYYIYFLIATVVYLIIDNIIVSSMSMEISGQDMWRNIIIALIWSAYMKKSERVKLTFIEP